MTSQARRVRDALVALGLRHGTYRTGGQFRVIFAPPESSTSDVVWLTSPSGTPLLPREALGV